MTDKITFVNGELVVPDEPTIPFVEGDGIGKDITPAVQKLVDAAVAHAYAGERRINWVEVLAGEKAFEKTGEWLPQATVDAFRDYLVSIKGPLGTPTGNGHRSINVTLRQELDLYACVRPIRYFEGVPAPVKHPELLDVTIFRENTEDIYAGIEWEAGTNEAKVLIELLQKEFGVTNIRFPETSSIGIKPISKEGSERLIRAAIKHALTTEKHTVTIVHKGNIQKFTEGRFLSWGEELAKREFGAELAAGKLVINSMIADNFLQQALLRPEQFDVVALTNLNGDYASDALAAQVGGIGIAPGANINYSTGHALFEATHGTAPDIAGKDIANPCSLLLSAVMLLEYIGWDEAAKLIITGVENTIASQKVTGDFARLLEGVPAVGTAEFTEAIISTLADGEPVRHILDFDGYAVGDRFLDGVIFNVVIDEYGPNDFRVISMDAEPASKNFLEGNNVRVQDWFPPIRAHLEHAINCFKDDPSGLSLSDEVKNFAEETGEPGIGVLLEI